jgi:hypothetical protein
MSIPMGCACSSACTATINSESGALVDGHVWTVKWGASAAWTGDFANVLACCLMVRQGHVLQLLK